MKKTSRIYYLSKRKYISDFMTKVKFKRIFTMKSHTQKKFLPKKTQEAVDELISYNCAIDYVVM